MKEILNLLTKENILKEGETFGDKEAVAIYNATTGEEIEQYHAIIQLYLENEIVPDGDVKVAVSYFYMKLNLLDRKLIEL